MDGTSGRSGTAAVTKTPETRDMALATGADGAGKARGEGMRALLIHILLMRTFRCMYGLCMQTP